MPWRGTNEPKLLCYSAYTFQVIVLRCLLTHLFCAPQGASWYAQCKYFALGSAAESLFGRHLKDALPYPQQLSSEVHQVFFLPCCRYFKADSTAEDIFLPLNPLCKTFCMLEKEV